MKTLIVDDSAEDRKILRLNMERRGCVVLEAANGEEALALAGANGPNLIISDALMPKMDGFQFLRTVRSNPDLAHIPFIFYSAVYTGNRDRELALALGADAFIEKPKEPEEFWNEVSAILEGCELKTCRPGEPLIEKEEEYLRRYSEVVATKLEEKYRELQKSEELLRIVLDTLPVGVWVIGRDGRIQKGNRAAREIWCGARYVGLEEYGEYKGWWSDTGKPIAPDEWGVARALAKAETSLEEVIDIEAFDGTRKTILHSSAPLRDQNREIIGAIAVNQDITARKQAEDEIRSLKEELELRVARRTAELEAANLELQAFNYSVSHDLRAPLTIIDGFSKAVMEDYADRLDEVGVDYLQRVRGASRRMGKLIDALLNLAGIGRRPLTRETANLSEIARTIEGELRYLHPERRVTITIADGVTVQGDRLLLRAVMENLLGNAWKYSRPRDEAEIEFGVTTRGEETVYFVRDNGIGFSMRYADRLFAPFQRLHRADEFSGTGIGLATVQRIIHRHGGRVWAEAEEDKGATFYFTLGESPTPHPE